VVRLLRTLRMVRLVRFITALRQLIHSILTTLKSLVWAMLLLVMILYGFGVAFTHGVADFYLTGGDIPSRLVLVIKQHWGSLPKVMRTLFMSITGGLNWWDVLEPLLWVSYLWVMLFFFYIIFTYFAVCNAITGVFCQSAIDSSLTDKEMVTMQMLSNKKLYIEALEQVFEDMDTDSSGQVTMKEFEDYLQDEKCIVYLDSLGIQTQDAWALFKILDADMEGTLDVGEFVHGCLNFKGPAKAIHFARMENEVKALYRLVETRHSDLNCTMEALIKRLGGA